MKGIGVKISLGGVEGSPIGPTKMSKNGHSSTVMPAHKKFLTSGPMTSINHCFGFRMLVPKCKLGNWFPHQATKKGLDKEYTRN